MPPSQFKLFTILVFFLITSLYAVPYARAIDLDPIQINPENFLLFDIKVNGSLVVQSLDAYQVQDRLLIAVEPLFDSLKLKYQLNDSLLTVWLDEKKYEVNLLSDNKLNSGNWASDGFYVFIDSATLSQILDVDILKNLSTLVLKLTSKEPKFKFPFERLRDVTMQRALDKLALGYIPQQQATYPITINDQYRLYTIPHGRIRASLDKSGDKEQLNGSIQLVSDLLYHSANLTLSKSNSSDLAGNLSFSRFKSSPEDLILGAFDYYRVGDVSNNTNLISSQNSSGVGFNLSRLTENYRPNNSSTTLRETAPPGWDAELFRNSEFLKKSVVPDDGQLVFTDVELYYGSNDFIIKLYGPYGETRQIKKRVDLKRNSLAEGDIAYSLYGLDSRHRLINDANNGDFKLRDFGARFDYGINDNWQTGVSLNILENDKQFINFKNAFSFPNFLVENTISLDQDANYAQLTTLTGSVFDDNYYSINIESAHNFESSRINALGTNVTRISASYSLPFDIFSNTFFATYQENGSTQNANINHSISFALSDLLFRNTLTYSYFKNKTFDINNTNESYSGTLGISGSLFRDLRVSANLNYDPKDDNFIQKSSSLNLVQRLQDTWDNYHYLTLRYLPLSEGQTSKWRLDYRTAIQNEKFLMTFNTYYDQSNEWGLGLGIQFFMGYDYRNNSFIFDDQMNTNVASLDIHTYLDRQLNGYPDPLDYNLDNVQFSGIQEWQHITSTNTGRTILPGVPVNMVFPFSAKWQQGSTTINNDYAVYTHPGAYVDVNMPFLLSTDLSGFVLRQKGNNEAGLVNTVIHVIDENGAILRTEETDMDGYYEFLRLAPGKYQVRIADDFLKQNGYTSDTVGFSVTTAGAGGYAELPAFHLRRKNSIDDKDDEHINLFVLDKSNTEQMVWDDDESKRRNYFTLPAKHAISALHSLTQENAVNGKVATPKTMQEVHQIVDDSIEYKDEKAIKTSKRLPSLRILAPVATSNSNTTEIVTNPANTIMMDKIEPPSTFMDEKSSTDVNNGLMTIQLASYQSLDEAKLQLNKYSNLSDGLKIMWQAPYYKIIYGTFSSIADGNQFAKANLEETIDYFVRPLSGLQPIDGQTKIVTDEAQSEVPYHQQGWVVQLSAQKSADPNELVLKQYAKLDEIFTATKSTNNNILHCVISRIFDNKKEANKYISDNQLHGWTVRSQTYQNIRKLK